LTPTEWEPESGDGLCPCRCMVAGTAIVGGGGPGEAPLIDASIFRAASGGTSASLRAAPLHLRLDMPTPSAYTKATIE